MSCICSKLGASSYVADSFFVQLGLALATAVGVVALYKASQGKDLDSAARDIKYGAKNAVGNAENQANRAANNIKRNT